MLPYGISLLERVCTQLAYIDQSIIEATSSSHPTGTPYIFKQLSIDRA